MREKSLFQPLNSDQRDILRELRRKQKREGFFRLDARAKVRALRPNARN